MTLTTYKASSPQGQSVGQSYERKAAQCGKCSIRHNFEQNTQQSQEVYAPKRDPIIDLIFDGNDLEKKVQEKCSCDCHAGSVDASLEKDISDTYKKGAGRHTDDRFAQSAKLYFAGEGKELGSYLAGQKRKQYDLQGVETKDLGDVIAAVVMQGDSAKLVGSREFDAKVKNLAQNYHVPLEVAKRYVFDHEQVHLWQKGMYFDSPVQAELDVESTLRGYYAKKASGNEEESQTYKALERIADHRVKSVNINYGNQPYRAKAGLN